MPILKLGRMFETTNTEPRKEDNVLSKLSVTAHCFIVNLLHYTSLAHYANLRSQGSFSCRKRGKAVPRFLINSRFIQLFSRFYYNALVNSHSQLSVYSKDTHSKRPVVSTWNSAIYGVIKHVPHICLFGYVDINEITYQCQSN